MMEQRRPAAIVAAEVVGYSRLIGCDESGTLAALMGCGVSSSMRTPHRSLSDFFVGELAGPAPIAAPLRRPNHALDELHCSGVRDAYRRQRFIVQDPARKQFRELGD